MSEQWGPQAIEHRERPQWQKVVAVAVGVALAAVGFGMVLAGAGDTGPGVISGAPSVTATTVAAGPELGSEAQRQAARKAESYLRVGGFSRAGLIDQLEFEQFSRAEAVAGVDSLAVDWEVQAGRKAESYLDVSSFSCGGLVDQLEFEGFSRAEAVAGAGSTGIC